MRLLTYGDDPTKVRYLKNFENIGLEHPFIDLFSKFDAMKKWLIKEAPNDDEIIVFVDGYDVVQRRTDLEEFEKEFINFGAEERSTSHRRTSTCRMEQECQNGQRKPTNHRRYGI